MANISNAIRKRILRIAIQFAGIAALIVLDQVIKQAVTARIAGKGEVTVIPGILGLLYAKNTGAALKTPRPTPCGRQATYHWHVAPLTGEGKVIFGET